jgi:hypothetical protein
MRDAPEESVGMPFDVACDESGSEGEHLIGANTDVFAHGSVHLALDEAAASVQEVRDRVRSPATEYKANHLLREKQRAVLEWILGPDGPLLGQAHVHLTDKTAYVVDRLVLVLTGRKAPATCSTLLQAGPALGDRWQRLLHTSNDLLRSRSLLAAPMPVDAFFTALDDIAGSGDLDGAAEAFATLASGRERAEAYRSDVAPGPPVVPLLEPFYPALLQTIVYWSGRLDQPVAVVHDETNTLTSERLEHLRRLAGPALASFNRVDSTRDARVQLADFLAGVARKLASDALRGRADRPLVELLRPYVDSASVWGDPVSGAQLGLPAPEIATGG